MSYHTRALVLLGNSGVGKDTICSLFLQEFPNAAVNVKFGSLGKRIAADLFNTVTERMENKEWRETVRWQEQWFTPMDLLTTLFHGCKHCPAMMEANIKFALANAPKDKLLICTDLRRPEEYEALCREVDCVDLVHLSSRDVPKGVNDDKLNLILDRAQVYYQYSRDNKSPLATYQTIRDCTGDIHQYLRRLQDDYYENIRSQRSR